MSKHARPHLQTHTRSEGHSSVAGAAYRLGLRLYDERTGLWHDFRKRELGEEIVRALTVAPEGAPAWATDPAQLWNRVEAAEKRKDAQVARDYRIPIPFGLPDDRAGDLAEEMARFIADELQTPVSVGLHRDADRDVLGVIKPTEKQGFHAHLYFPTRKLADWSGGNGSGEGEGGAAEVSGFGAKLSMLSNKRTSIAFVEALNAKWAALANHYTAALGLTADYDHRSYERMGLNLVPQPTVGRHVAAMERQGISTVKGDILKEALVMAQVYERAHVVALEAQHAQALADRRREAGQEIAPVDVARADRDDRGPGGTAPAAASIPVVFPSRYPISFVAALPLSSPPTAEWENRERENTEREASQPSPLSLPRSSAPLPVPPPQLSLPSMPAGSLASRLFEETPPPQDEAEQEDLARTVQLVHELEPHIQTTEIQFKAQERLSEAAERARAHALEAQCQIDRSRQRRAVARIKVHDWRKAHPIRVWLMRVIGPAVMPAALRQLHADIALHDRHVQDFKRSRQSLGVAAENAGRELAMATVELTEQQASLKQAIEALARQDAAVLPRLLSLLPFGQRQLVRREMEALAREGGAEEAMIPGATLSGQDFEPITGPAIGPLSVDDQTMERSELRRSRPAL